MYEPWTRQPVQESSLRYEGLSGPLRDVLEYWRGLGGETLACSWAQFDLLAMPHHLIPSTMVVNIGATMKDNRFRYWGSKMTEVRGSDRTGKSPYDITPKEVGQSFYDSHSDIIKNPRWTAHHYKISWASEVERVHSVLRLPLSEDGKTVSQIVIVADFSAASDVTNRIKQEAGD
ncbi:MAG TPA: hypothetical protein DIW51_02555 [Rhodospirillaceae bacterium]|nr:hypothetical protein [Rhodospirillaceae bacterium]